MQKLIIFLYSFFLIYSDNIAQNTVFKQIKSADSLFESKKYKESYDLYYNIYKQNYGSKSMFLKMAYFNEALGNIPETMLFLHKANEINPDESILKKISQLATNNNLKGYEITDLNYINFFIYKYWFIINVVIMMFMLFLLSYIILLKLKKQSNHIVFGVLITLIFALIFFNFYSIPSKSIIVINDKINIYDNPSAGANVINTYEMKGYKFEVEEKCDIWIKIRTNDSIPSYIRSFHTYEL